MPSNPPIGNPDAEARSGAQQAGVTDEQRLIYWASGAYEKAKSPAELDEAYRTYVACVEDAISFETKEILSRLYSLRLSTLSWE